MLNWYYRWSVQPEKTHLPKKLENFASESCQKLTKEQGDEVRAPITEQKDFFGIREGPKETTIISSTQYTLETLSHPLQSLEVTARRTRGGKNLAVQ
ncbi:hypothetical protein J6590_076130 [Homalodisca vitripennis]|nr:hypothetical protein J6590_076130 [Homalodisca vitripennis]